MNNKTKTKSYEDYLKTGNKVNPAYLAPLTALPKRSKGDNAGFRFKQQTINRNGTVTVKQLYIPKNGYLVHKAKETL